MLNPFMSSTMSNPWMIPRHPYVIELSHQIWYGNLFMGGAGQINCVLMAKRRRTNCCVMVAHKRSLEHWRSTSGWQPEDEGEHNIIVPTTISMIARWRVNCPPPTPLFIVGSFNDLVKFSSGLLQFVVCSKGAAEKIVVHNKSSWVTFSPHQSSSSP